MNFEIINELPKVEKHYKECKLQRFLTSFVNSGFKKAEVKDFGNRKPTILCNNLRVSVRRMGYPIKVHCISGRVFLTLED